MRSNPSSDNPATLDRSYEYDHVGRLSWTYTGAEATAHAINGQVVAELNWFSVAWGWSRGYVYGGYGLLAVQQDAQVRWVHEDPVTKTKRMTDANGAVISTIVLDPWGGAMGGPWSQNVWQQRRQFTTYERDGNESDEAMFRRYNRWHSRFDQPDPYDGSYDLTDPQSFNRYGYVQSDPVNFVDPSGLCPQGTTAATDPETGKTECVPNPTGSVDVTPDPDPFWDTFSAGAGRPLIIDMTLIPAPLIPLIPEVGKDASENEDPAGKDPCAGVRPHDLNYSRVRKYRRGGRQSAEQHIRSRHLSGNIRNASQYFGTFNIVRTYNMLTFTFGERSTTTDGGFIFELQFPFAVGTNMFEPTGTIDWNLLRLEKDCKTVNTSHPGRIS